MKLHNYTIDVKWKGNVGRGTESYTSYKRNHIISSEGKTIIDGSSDPSFRGDKTKYSPEDLLVASISACHMLWFLHLCADAKIIVEEYTDTATGIMEETPDGGGRFREVTLRPDVVITDELQIEKASKLHDRANKLCFIANSCNFPVYHEPIFRIKSA